MTTTTVIEMESHEAAEAAGPVLEHPIADGTAHPAATPATPSQGPENAFAITSFVLGIASIVSGWTFVAPIVGLIFGVLALRRNTAERTLALWGVWMNVAMLALAALGLLALIVFAGIALAAGLPFIAS